MKFSPFNVLTFLFALLCALLLALLYVLFHALVHAFLFALPFPLLLGAWWTGTRLSRFTTTACCSTPWRR